MRKKKTKRAPRRATDVGTVENDIVEAAMSYVAACEKLGRFDFGKEGRAEVAALVDGLEDKLFRKCRVLRKMRR